MCGGYVDWFEGGFYVVFVFQVIGCYVELQYVDCIQDQVVVGQWVEELGCVFFGQLGQVFLQLFEFEWIMQVCVVEQFWGEVGNVGEGYCFVFGEGIVDGDGVVVVDVDYIVGLCFGCDFVVVGYEGQCVGQFYFFVGVYVEGFYVGVEMV